MSGTGWATMKWHRLLCIVCRTGWITKRLHWSRIINSRTGWTSNVVASVGIQMVDQLGETQLSIWEFNISAINGEND